MGRVGPPAHAGKRAAAPVARMALPAAALVDEVAMAPCLTMLRASGP